MWSSENCFKQFHDRIHWLNGFIHQSLRISILYYDSIKYQDWRYWFFIICKFTVKCTENDLLCTASFYSKIVRSRLFVCLEDKQTIIAAVISLMKYKNLNLTLLQYKMTIYIFNCILNGGLQMQGRSKTIIINHGIPAWFSMRNIM